MRLIQIDNEKCNHDGLCVRACPVNILKQEKGKIPFSADELENKCIHCGHCVSICPTEALTHRDIELSDFLPVPEDIPSAEMVESLLLARRSARFFSKKPIPKNQLLKLLDVVRHAPTASNSQQIYWSVINSADRLEEIRNLTLKWIATDPKRSYHIKASESGLDVVLRGGTTLAVAFAPEKYLFNECDSAIALTYMELMATSMNLGACWGGLVSIASRFIPELNKVLGVPDEHKVGGSMILGIPSIKHKLIPPRKNVRVKWI